MQVHIKPNYKPQKEVSLEEANRMLINGELDGDEPAWTAGLSTWTILSDIAGIIIPSPPPLPDYQNKSKPHPIARIRSTPLRRSNTQSINKKGPIGVKGWLLFFCIALVILGPILSFGGMTGNWEKSKPIFEILPSLKLAMTIENFGITVMMITGFLVGIKVWGGNPRGKKMAQAFLKFRIIGFLVIEILAFLIIFPNLPSSVVPEVVGGYLGVIFREFIVCLTWWFYLKKSKRVRNTFPNT